MLWPRGTIASVVGMSPQRFANSVTTLPIYREAGDRYNSFISGSIALAASFPDGAAPHGSHVLPIRAGGMAGATIARLFGSGNILSGGPLAGGATMTLTGAGNLGLVISMSGTAAMTITGTGGVALTIGLTGDGALSLTGTGGLSMIVPIAGDGVLTLAGAGDLRGLLSLSTGTIDAGLTAEGIAGAVWGAIAASNDTAGTMGALLNASGAGGDPWAVTLEGSYTAADLMRLLAAALAGKVSGGGGSTVTFRDMGDTKDRIVATVDTFGNRTAITRDAT